MKNVKVKQGMLPASTSTDAIVSPANSFGFMGGGIDAAYARFFGRDLESRLQAKLRKDFYGGLPVGQAILLLPTQHRLIPWLISAPTMRVPMDISNTPNAFLAFRLS